MNSRLKRLLLPLLRSVAKGGPVTFRMKSAASQALFLAGERPSLKTTAAKKKIKAGRAAARQAKNMTTVEIRAAVFKRAGGYCEVCDLPVGGDDMDHWLGGSGRKTQKQSVENTWLLCRGHHVARTENRPSAEEWNHLFERHCQLNGYKFTPHVVHDPVPAAAAPPSPQGRNAVAAGPEEV